MTTDLTTYQPRLDALARATGGSVNIEFNLWYDTTREWNRASWSVFLAAGSDTGEKLFQGSTLDHALENAERECDLTPSTAITLVLP